MTEPKFKVGDYVTVIKTRRNRAGPSSIWNGTVFAFKKAATVNEHYIYEVGTADRQIGWFESSLELNDHIQPCACFGCPS